MLASSTRVVLRFFPSASAMSFGLMGSSMRSSSAIIRRRSSLWRYSSASPMRDHDAISASHRNAYSFTRTPGRFSVAVTSLRRHEIEHPLAVLWYPSVQIHQMGKLLRHSLRNRGYYYPSVAMTDEHHLFQVLIFDYCENVLNVRVQSGHTTE